MSTSNIAPWFGRLSDVIHHYNLISSRIFNIDEPGFQEGESSIRKDAGSRAIKSSQRGSSANTAWISIIECICANRTRLHPTVLFKGERPQPNWVSIDRPLPRWNYQATNTGWVNSYITLSWLKNCFNETRPADPSQ
jgi:hypothetical protein